MIARPLFHWVRAEFGYPELASRKKLVAHLLLARAQATHALALHDKAAEWENNLREAVRNAAADFDRTQKNDLPLSDHVASVLAVFRSKPPDAADSEKARELFEVEVDILEHDATPIDCKACAGRRPVCNDQEKTDDVNMLNEPICWRHIDELVNYALNTANTAYGRIFLPGAKSIPVEVAVAVIPGIDLGGEVTFPEDDSLSTRRSNVEYSIPETINHDQYLRSLHTIFHEVFVHAGQALYVRGQRPVLDELCSFTEGFVDAAGTAVLRGALGSASAEAFGNATLPLRFGRGARAAHDKRTEVRPANDPLHTVAAHRLAGSYLFEQVSGILGGIDLAIDVTIRLNLLLGTPEVRNEIHDVLTWMIRASTPAQRKAIQAVRRFAVDGDWPELRRILRIESQTN